MITKDTSEATTIVDYKVLKVSSTAFQHNGLIPFKYTCDGENINPPLSIQSIPEDTKSLAIIIDDPDAPSGTFCHWIVWNIPVTHEIREKESRGAQGANDYDHHRYDGPCPPAGMHRYMIKVYALNSSINLPVSADKWNLEKAMSEHIIGFGFIIGKYQRAI